MLSVACKTPPFPPQLGVSMLYPMDMMRLVDSITRPRLPPPVTNPLIQLVRVA